MPRRSFEPTKERVGRESFDTLPFNTRPEMGIIGFRSCDGSSVIGEAFATIH